MIGGHDIVIQLALPPRGSAETLETFWQWLDGEVRRCPTLGWPTPVVEVENDREHFYYRDTSAKNAWDEDGGTEENQDTMIYAILSEDNRELTLVVSHNEGASTAKFAEMLKASEDEERKAIQKELAAGTLAQERHLYLAPSCCERSLKWKAVYADETGQWRLRLSNSFDYDTQLAEAYRQSWTENAPPDRPSHCPFCGAKLRALVKRDNPPQPLMNPDDYRCTTCKERNMNCVCWPPWFAFEEAP